MNEICNFLAIAEKRQPPMGVFLDFFTHMIDLINHMMVVGTEKLKPLAAQM